MSEGLKITIGQEGDSLLISFEGLIDEDSNFSELDGKIKGKVIFDFEKVSLINSCGIREWVNFLESVDKDSVLVYRNCRQIIIEQINMVHGFIREGATVESFYAPYYCEDCDKEFKMHLKVSDVKGSSAPAVKCPDCGSDEMEFDAIEEQYFQFIK
ncbi:hypothetical protein BIY24_13445 [Halobacteriovorax marinus]|uniref:hypothetical protein n=1 Tax=Halobacteriovorax marinus TaxID=97084 RepID=UPI000BC34DEC|nr:hypothetical protein [Halobacteriovorax marinus]ATH08914.1 hypothetical protein BIY24_13445 [Halobacteriovorax marinus]